MNPFGARITQLSFKRLPNEHADVMLRAGRLFLQSRSRRKPVPYLIGAVIFGVVCGVGIEAFRQFVLAPYFGIDTLPTIQVVAFEMLPVMLAIGAGAVIQREIVRRGRRKRLIASLAENVMIDVDIYERGMETSTGGVFTYCSWPAFRDVQLEKAAISFFRDDALFSIPARAFKDRKEFEVRGREIVDLWKQAKKGGREAPPVSAAPPLDLAGETRH
ncbi:hypothetical protein [Rhizobium sp. C4]|uniref:hypothetical protein n=1 Tax=Rhizobium sp. C4 TaxID=1349800 RepID=UPI001E47CD82|nr:hypothetical protein [Rhizobium sp. C4]MCD2175850.1 hypothetical protein [Rhizobium sp. C4]